MDVANPATSQPTREEIEWAKCADDPAYFIDAYCQIYDGTSREWIAFRLWDSQLPVIDTIYDNSLVVILKARQLGMTWLCLGYSLWLMVFRPGSTILLFSKGEEEAIYLLGKERLRGMYRRLPAWMKVEQGPPSKERTWTLLNGSVARAFGAKGGDSYTATFALVDEADLCPDLATLLQSAKPTIDGGGQMVLLSRSDKSKPESEFKAIYRAAEEGTVSWKPVFLAWDAHPGRDDEWYERQRNDILQTTGSDDDLFESYPSTPEEAMAPKSLDKRIAPQWLRQCLDRVQPMRRPYGNPDKCPSVPNLELYRLPEQNHRYVIGGDPAEENPTSDPSAFEVIDRVTGEEVASFNMICQPSTFASYLDAIGRYFNGADLMVERNNHGHAVLVWLRDNSRLRLLAGHDAKLGWLSSTKGKALLYEACADGFRNEETIIHSMGAYWQLSSIEGATLRAPEGQHDDRADAYALALAGIARTSAHTTPPRVIGTAPGGCNPYNPQGAR